MTSWPERSIKACPSCGNAMSQGMCWRMTCPSNGGSQRLLAMVRDRAMVASQERARRVMRSSLFDPPPPDKALAFVFDDEVEEEDWPLPDRDPFDEGF